MNDANNNKTGKNVSSPAENLLLILGILYLLAGIGGAYIYFSDYKLELALIYGASGITLFVIFYSASVALMHLREIKNKRS